MDKARTLVIGGIEIPEHASLQLDQEYRKLGGRVLHRMNNGDARPQTSWHGKLGTVINGSGSIPPGIQELDEDTPQLIKCVGTRRITSATNIITLPSARRTDAGYTPFGVARVGLQWVETNVDLVGDLATLTTVSGASLYQASYFPEINCYINEYVETVDDRNQDYAWTLTAEEI